MSEARPHRCPGSQPFLPHWPSRIPQSRRLWVQVARPGRSAGSRGSARRLPAVAHFSARPGHLPAKAKRCIFLFMTGGPSQMDLFDPKPLLNRLDSQPLPQLRQDPRKPVSRRILFAWEAVASGASTASAEWTCRTWCRISTRTPMRSPGPLVLRRQRDPCSSDVGQTWSSHQPRPPSLGNWVTYGLVRPTRPPA